MRVRAFPPCCACAAWLALAACNAVLGIERPSDLVFEPRPADAGADAEPIDPQEEANPPQDAGAGAESGLPVVEAVPYAWADWPMPNPASAEAGTGHAYLSGRAGVVIDAVTQLEWQRDVDDGSFSWEEAAEHCAGLSLAGGKFRLPTRIELLSIVDYTQTRPTIDAAGFPDTPPEKFWSASPFAGAEQSAWVVNFDFGTGFVFAAETEEQHRVRCVR
jgi:Protein of unknown function (DUF1566)